MYDLFRGNTLLIIIIILAIIAPSFLVGAMQVVFYVILALILCALILGLVFRSKIKKMQDQMQDQMRNGEYASQGTNGYDFQNNSSKQDDDVKIYAQPGTGEKRMSDNVGEYVDFEEVDDKK